jgi:hypothetical protein
VKTGCCWQWTSSQASPVKHRSCSAHRPEARFRIEMDWNSRRGLSGPPQTANTSPRYDSNRRRLLRTCLRSSSNKRLQMLDGREHRPWSGGLQGGVSQFESHRHSCPYHGSLVDMTLVVMTRVFAPQAVSTIFIVRAEDSRRMPVISVWPDHLRPA